MHMQAVIICLLSLVVASVLLFIFFFIFACFRGCCKCCKKDFTRTDYRKHEKVLPGIWFVVLNILGFCLVGLTLFQFTNMWFFFADTFCKAINFITALELKSAISLTLYTNAINFLEKAFEPILYINLSFIILLAFCYLFGLLVICCVMITKKRACKNISHIAWVSGITTLLVAALIGCIVTFGGLQIWDACQVY